MKYEDIYDKYELEPLSSELKLVPPPPWHVYNYEDLTEKYIEVMVALQKYGGSIVYKEKSL